MVDENCIVPPLRPLLMSERPIDDGSKFAAESVAGGDDGTHGVGPGMSRVGPTLLLPTPLGLGRNPTGCSRLRGPLRGSIWVPPRDSLC
jgi:hypothetical protein